jgi:hypothetical protein
MNKVFNRLKYGSGYNSVFMPLKKQEKETKLAKNGLIEHCARM